MDSADQDPQNSTTGSNILRKRALFGDDMPEADTERNAMLRVARHIRSLRSWVTEGSYAWWRLTDDLKRAQRKLLEIKRA